jgi:hypothetical protein
VSISISGQNERWAQLSAYQPPPMPRPGQSGGSDPSVGTTTAPGSPGTNNSTPASTSGALSDGMSFALMAFSGSWGVGTGTSSQGANQSTGTSNAAAPGSTPSTSNGTSPQSQLLTDVQSLLSALTGSSGSASGATTSSAAASSTGSGAGTQTGLSSSILQDLQTVASDLGAISSASGTSQPGGTASPQGAPPWGNDSSNNDISNTGTSASDGNAGGWRPGYSDGFQQQYAASAYGAGMTSGLDGSTTSALASITV